MTASIGHPTLRLIRVRIKNVMLEDLKPGEVRILKSKEINELKGLYDYSPFTKKLF
jgi:23S rRNA pseudouridine2457 synthase